MSSVLAEAVEHARRELELTWAHEEQRQVELTEAERYARDPLAWCNSGHVWIASPFGPGVEIPDTIERWTRFKSPLRPVPVQLFPDQERTIAAWVDLPHLAKTGQLIFRNTVLEKSRQIGETWTFALVICWALHYHRVTGMAMHVDGGEIDDGGERNTVKSLFGKVRYIDRRLDRSKVAGLGQLRFRPFSRDPAKVENTTNGSVVYGEGQTDDPGRGGTFDFVLIDEAAFVMHGERVYAAVDEACPNGKALLSTVNGEGTFHARLADERPLGYTYLRLHWSTHPIYRRGLHVAGEDKRCKQCNATRAKVPWSARKPLSHRFPGALTSPWYDWRVIGKTDEQVANELDIDRERALGGRVYREFSTEVHLVEAGIPFDPLLPVELAWDYGTDTTTVIVLQDAPDSLRAIGILEMGSEHESTAIPDTVSPALRELLGELGVEQRLLAPEWTRRIYGVGDPAGHAKTLDTGKPFVNAYRRQGFVIGHPSRRLTRTVGPSIDAVKRLLLGGPKPFRICGVNAAVLAVHLRNNVWPTDSTGRRRIGSTTPYDDVHNHSCRALAYYALAKFPPPTEPDSMPTAAVVSEQDQQPQAESPLARRRRRARGVGDGIRPGMSL